MARMVDVFLIREASMHAWQGIGVSPRDKAKFEEAFGKTAYEMAIAFIPQFKIESAASEESEGLDCTLYGVAEASSGEEYFMKIGQRLERDPKFAESLRKAAVTLRKLGPDEGYALLDQIIAKHRPKRPENYNSEEDVILTTREGWKWVGVSGQDCKDYEGELMSHCGTSEGEMASLRDPRGKPHVTADLSPDMRFVGQLRWNRNQVVDRKYWEMCAQLFQELVRLSGAKPEFDDPVYRKSADGMKFMEFLEERDLASTPANLLSPI